MKYKIGDVVWLRSGGPAMTVAKLLSGGSIWVTWFDETMNIRNMRGPSVCFLKYPPKVKLKRLR